MHLILIETRSDGVMEAKMCVRKCGEVFKLIEERCIIMLRKIIKLIGLGRVGGVTLAVLSSNHSAA